MTGTVQEAIRELGNQLAGELIQPEDPEYDEARLVWNGMIDRHPALIARCANVEDVVASVNFARQQEMLVSVRGGRHNVAGHATNDGGLVIDLSPMNRVEVDVEGRIARAGGGATIGDLDGATQPHGLATPMGVVTATGIAGLTLGGGFGWLRNKYGLSCDNLIAAEVVTADGRVVEAGFQENADLLWGLRGGGGNFGIVTEFTYQLYPVGPDVMFVFVFHDARGQRMHEAIRFGRDFAMNAPDEVSMIMALGQIPPEEEHFPADLHNVPFVVYGAMYAGPAEEGKRLLQPLIDVSEPLLDFSGVMPYLEAQQIFDADYPDGRRYYWKSLNLNRFDDQIIDRIVQFAHRQPSPYSTIDLWPIGGAVSRARPDESAFFGRKAAVMLGGEANWLDAADDTANINWLRALIADMDQFSDGSRYLNFAGFQEEGDEMMEKAFGPQYERLAVLKRKYDPDNFFRLNQNIKP